MENILGQALTHQYPAHPHFEVDKITKGNLTNAFGEIEEAVRSEGGRHEVPKAKRSEVRQVVVPMKLADMGEMHLHLSEDWKTHFIKCQSKESALFTVANLRRWIDEPKPMGLLKEFSDLVILSFAAQTNKSFYYHGGPAPDVEIGRLDDSMELREEELPSEELWKLAVEMSAAIFGVVSSKLLNATNVRKLIDDIQKVIITHRKQCGDLVGHLQRLYKQFGVDSKSSRLATANEVHGLLERLITSDGSAFIERLATESSDSSAAAMGKSLKSAAQVGSTLCNEFVWEIINELTSRGGDQQDKAEALKAEVIQALSDDEYVTSLSQALEKICIEAKNLIRGYSDSKPTLETPAVNKKDGVKVISVCDGVEEELTIVQLEETLDVLRSKLSEDSGYRVKLTWEVYKT